MKLLTFKCKLWTVRSLGHNVVYIMLLANICIAFDVPRVLETPWRKKEKSVT
jgi:hypothetical protein